MLCHLVLEWDSVQFDVSTHRFESIVQLTGI